MLDIVKFDSVSKFYKHKKEKFIGIEDISFSIKKGSIVGLIGPNGAGKSTTVKLLCGILKADSGKVSALGLEPWKKRRKLARSIGVMFGNRSSLWYNIPAIESVYLMKDIYGIEDEIFKERLDMYTNILDLHEILKKPVRKMSLGQRIKIELLVTILHHPELIILDEPTIGLDIVAKNNFREILLNLAKESQTTIILTTHDLMDVEKICDKIILINKGKKIIDLDKLDFKNWMEEYTVIYVDKNNEYDIRNEEYFREENPQYYKFYVPSDVSKEFIDKLYKKFGLQIKFKIEKPSLEDMVYEYYS
ncbi:ATP-binding cassette domain-containing protein [Clostridiaceae bacterium M8S5]|nr:ATP-binding cassette domain-containing protein [Clostridiaceae bacterium M8S5]